MKNRDCADGEILRLEDVSLHFAPSGRRVLGDITWSIGRGERWVLFGRNGAGKTKLLEIMTGYLFPSTGRVLRFGMELCDMRDLRRHIGYVGTSLREGFRREERVIDVVISGIDATVGLYRDPAAGEIDGARLLLRKAGLSHLEESFFGTLSDGEKQRILMLRAAACAPDILVLDEPAEGLDLAAREDLLATVAVLAEARNAAVVYVTHHVEEITPLFTDCYMLHEGGSLYCGKLESGLTVENLSRLFGRAVGLERRHGRYYAYALPSR